MADASGYDPKRDPNWVREDYNPDAIIADPDAHPIHKVYAAINIGIRDRGENWAKCANCGNPYQLTDQWGNGTVCSDSCEREFAADLGLAPTGMGTYRSVREPTNWGGGSIADTDRRPQDGPDFSLRRQEDLEDEGYC